MHHSLSFLQVQTARLRVRLRRFRVPPIQGPAYITHARGGAVRGSRGHRGTFAAVCRRDDNTLRKLVGKLNETEKGGA